MGEGSPRWAQLSYASFDAGTGFGGWQVKEQRGELTEAESERLRARVVTSFDSHEEVPLFATPEAAEGLDRRFTYVRAEDGSAAYWHAVQSGNDSTGRPGNVFSHILLDRRPSEPRPLLRPTDLWHSPDLLTPFGPEGVLAATLGPHDLPADGDAASIDSVVEFLFGSDEWRVGRLCVLMDAVAAALDGRARVVFATESTDSAARWIAAVLHLTSPAVARTISWSLYERVDALDSAWARGIHLCAIPLADAHLVKPTDKVVFLSESETPRIGALGGQHTTAAGSTVAVTAWSEMAQMGLGDEESARALLERLDDTVARVGDAGLHRAWPLAVAVMLGGEEMMDAVAFAHDIVRTSSPDSVADHPDLFDLVVGTGGSRGVTTEQLWRSVVELDGRRGLLAYAAASCAYLERVLADDALLDRDATVSVPAPGIGGPQKRVLRQAELALDHAVAREPSAENVARDLRLIDLLVRSGTLAPDGGEPSLRARADELIARDLEYLIADHDVGTAIVGRLRAVAPETRGLLLAADFDETWAGGLPRGAVGMRLAPAVGEWLSAAAPQPILAAESSSSTRGRDLELAAALLRRSSTAPGVRGFVATALLETHQTWAELTSAAPALWADGPWGARDLLAVETAHPGLVPEGDLVTAFVRAEWSTELDQLARVVAQRGATSAAGATGELRREAHTLSAEAIPAGGSGSGVSTPDRSASVRQTPSAPREVVSAVLSLREPGYQVLSGEIAALFVSSAVIECLSEPVGWDADGRRMLMVEEALDHDASTVAAALVARWVDRSTAPSESVSTLAAFSFALAHADELPLRTDTPLRSLAANKRWIVLVEAGLKNAVALGRRVPERVMASTLFSEMLGAGSPRRGINTAQISVTALAYLDHIQGPPAQPRQSPDPAKSARPAPPAQSAPSASPPRRTSRDVTYYPSTAPRKDPL